MNVLDLIFLNFFYYTKFTLSVNNNTLNNNVSLVCH